MSDEGNISMLRNLPVLEPDAARAERVRARYRAAMAQHQLQAARSARRAEFTARVLEHVLVGGLCLIYLSAIVGDVLRLRGID
jgi:hypothetical protein